MIDVIFLIKYIKGHKSLSSLQWVQKKHTIKVEAISYKTLTKYKEKKRTRSSYKDIQHTKKNTVLHIILHGKL